MSDFFGINTDWKDFDRLLSNDVLDEEPVPLEVFNSDNYYLGLPPLSELQLEVAKHLTQIFREETLIQLHGEDAGREMYAKYTTNEVICMLGKGCHAADTPVYNPYTGMWEPLSLMTNDVVVSHDGDVHESTQPFKEGYGKMVRVRTALGFEERVFIGHKYYSYKKNNFYKRNDRSYEPEWIRVDNLTIGDRIAVGVNFGVVNPQNIDDVHAELIGYWLGDGSMPTEKYQHINMDFCGDEKESLQRYLDLCEIIGDSPNIIDHRPDKNLISVRHYKTSNAVAIAKQYGLWNTNAYNKKIPSAVWGSSNDVLVKTIEKLWQTDGCVYNKNGATAEFVSVSKQLATDVQRGLLRLGIPSYIRSRVPKSNFENASEAWYVTVTSQECMNEFINKVNLLDHKNIYPLNKNGRIYKRLEENVYWDRIISIEDDGYDDFWTRTVPDTRNYLGNGLISSNSGKDHTSRVSMAYIIYLIHCLNDPLSYFNKAKGGYIDLVNLAVNAQQAKNVFFDPLKNLLLASDYFVDKGFEPRVSELLFFERPVRCFSGHSESEGWEGYDIILCVLDEIAAFKCLQSSTPVLTPNGWVKNGDLMAGDYVVGKDGKPVQILEVFEAGQKNVFEVEFEDGATVQCSDDHIWHVREYSDGRRPSYKDIELKDFKSLVLNGKFNQKRYAIPVVDAVEFAPSAPLPIDPYIMGILISEGGLTQRSIKFSSGDDFIINEVSKNLPSSLSVKSYGGCDYGISSNDNQNEILNYLKDFGLMGANSHTKFIPEPYLYASIDDRKALLAGLMDGDGTPARGHGSYTTVSERLKDDFVELCRGLGGVPTASLQSGGQWMICPRLPFNPFRLPRKAAKWKPHKRTLWRSIVDVRSLGYEEEMTCIKVANKDGLYVVDNYIVTHNTEAELGGERSKNSAKGIYDMARASVISRFPDVGKVALLSFPRYQGDFIMQRYRESIENEEPKVWQLKAATWEVNPTKKKEDFETEYRRNPVEARARFECEPPEMIDAFFRDPDLVRKAFIHGESPFNEGGTYKPWFNGSDQHLRYIHIDLGLKKDRSALTVVHSPGLREIKTMAGIEKLPIVNVDLVRYWEAPPNQEIEMAAIRHEIINLAKRFPVAKVTFDMWQCNMYDTLVPTDNGMLEIQDVKPCMIASTLNNKEEITNNFDSGEIPLLEIKVKNGYSIKCSPEHRLRVDTSRQWTQRKESDLIWKKAKDLTTDDKLVMKAANIWSDQKLISGAEAAFLGFAIAEGRKTEYRFDICNVDIDMINLVENTIKKISEIRGVNYSSITRKEKKSEIGIQYCEEVSVYGKKFMSYLESIGLKNVNSYNKEVPSTVLCSDKQIQKEFLMGLFEGDSGITTQSGHLSLEYNSRSEKLVDQVHQMLLNFGIVATKTSVERLDKPMYRLYITGQKAIKFVEEIGFLSKRKVLKSEQLAESTRSSRAPRYMPDEDGFFSAKITSIEDYGVARAYDLSVPGSESYVANGFISHNSADMMQSLNSAGILTEWHTVGKKDFDTLSTTIYDGRLRGYYDDAIKILVEDELLKLQLISNTKVDHPNKGSKDLADSLAGAVYQCLNNIVVTPEIEIEIYSEDDDKETWDQIELWDEKVNPINQKKEEEREMPEDIKDWLEMI